MGPALGIPKRRGGAYYLAGYAVELALKACIIKRLMATDAFPGRDFSRDCYTHDLEKLVTLAGLRVAFDAARGADSSFSDNWLRVKDWSEEKRYHVSSEAEAKELIQAIDAATHGVLTWVKTRW